MKKYCSVFSVLLIAFFLPFFIFTKETKAYFKDNCYALQYNVTVDEKDKITVQHDSNYYKGNMVWSTQKVCEKNGKIDVKAGLFSSGILDYPNFDGAVLGIAGDTLKFRYCSNGPIMSTKTTKCTNEKTKEFKRSDYTSFEKFAKAIQDFASGLGGGKDGKYKIIEMKKNDAKSSVAVVDSEGKELGSDAQCKAAAGALGWIICPIIQGIARQANNIYTEYIAPALHVEPKLFAGDENSGVRGGWETFRNFANIIFVILLLVVIFSQVSGVGIDNYGIKRILPKLIVSAVLINLSYVLCILAVDISNILGNGFQALFETLGEGLTSGTEASGAGLKSLAVTGGTLVGLGAFGYVAGSTAWAWAPLMIIPLLTAAISLMVSIMFLFILLSAREAAIIVLTVLAPVAVVLYALPNTKSYFDKWVKFFGALLMVYPIAGLLVGGGNYVSALLIAAGEGESFFTAFTAMIAGVVPIFFIPIVLKQSLAMAGNLGDRISSFGKATGARLGGMGGRSLERNERFANWQREMGRTAQLKSVGKTKDRIDRKTSRLANRYVAEFQSPGRSQEEAEALARAKAEGELSGADSRALARATMAEKAAKTEDIQSYMALINDQTNYGADKAGLAALTKGYASSGNKEAVLAAAKIAGRRKDTAADFMNNVLKTNDLDSNMKASLSKEIAEGETAGNYRAADAFGFQYASDVNAGETGAGYNQWKEGAGNLDKALKAHVTNTDELMGQQGSALNEIADAINSGLVSNDHATRIQGLAQTRIDTSSSLPGYDTTKDAQMQRLANGQTINVRQNVGGAGGADSVSE